MTYIYKGSHFHRFFFIIFNLLRRWFHFPFLFSALVSWTGKRNLTCQNIDFHFFNDFDERRYSVWNEINRRFLKYFLQNEKRKKHFEKKLTPFSKFSQQNQVFSARNAICSPSTMKNVKIYSKNLLWMKKSAKSVIFFSV